VASFPFLIAPLAIDPTDFPPLPLQPGFAQLVTDTLANSATPDDGFDQGVAEVVAIVDQLNTALGGLLTELLGAFAEADLIDDYPVTVNTQAFAASLVPVDASVGELGTLLSSAALPTPPGGGGGGGGGAPPPGGGSAAVAADFPGVNCWSAWDLTSPTQDIAHHGTYNNALEVMEAGSPPRFAVVTAFQYFRKDDNQWQGLYPSGGGGLGVTFAPSIVGKTKAVVQVTCTTAPTTRLLCIEKTVVAPS